MLKFYIIFLFLKVSRQNKEIRSATQLSRSVCFLKTYLKFFLLTKYIPLNFFHIFRPGAIHRYKFYYILVCMKTLKMYHKFVQRYLKYKDYWYVIVHMLKQWQHIFSSRSLGKIWIFDVFFLVSKNYWNTLLNCNSNFCTLVFSKSNQGTVRYFGIGDVYFISCFVV